MKLELFRGGLSATSRKVDEADWRQWAYVEATFQGVVPMVEPVIVTVAPTCKDWRGVAPTDSAWRVVEPILDGLVSAGLFPSKAAVLEVVLRRPMIGGRSGLTVTIADAGEPF